MMEISPALPYYSSSISANSKPQGRDTDGSRNRVSNSKSEQDQQRKSPEQIGEFKDKKGLEETTDLKIGPDIRFALRSRNPAFLQRILWGPLTVAEYREVKYRLTEIRHKMIRDIHLLPGKILIDEDKKTDGNNPKVSNEAGRAVNISV